MFWGREKVRERNISWLPLEPGNGTRKPGLCRDQESTGTLTFALGNDTQPSDPCPSGLGADTFLDD